MTRALILLGITALACHDNDASKPATPGSAAPTATVRAAPPVTRADQAPALPALGSGSGSGTIGTIADRFKAEDVDAAWKSRTEADIKKRLAKHPPAETECRASICRLTITGSEADIAATMDDLQALHDAAESVMLTRPEPTKIFAYLTYERADPAHGPRAGR